MSFHKQTIVPKTEGSGIRFSILGDYYLTLKEALFIGITIIFLILSWIYIPILWVKITITILLSVVWLLFIPAGPIKLYYALGKIFILKTTPNKINIIRPDLDNDGNFITYESNKTKMHYDVFELNMASLLIESEDGMAKAFDEFEKLLLRTDSVQWYISKQVLSQDLEDNIEYITSHVNHDNMMKEAMAKDYIESLNNASGMQFGRYYLTIQSEFKINLEKVSNNIKTFHGESVGVVSIPIKMKEEIILLQSDVFYEQNRIKFGMTSNEINGNHCEYLVLSSSRPILEWFWLIETAQDPNVRYSISGVKKDIEHAVKQLNRQLIKIKQKINQGTSDHVRESEWTEALESLQLTIDNLRGNEQNIFKSFIVIEIWGTTTKEASQKAKKLKNDLRRNGTRFSVPIAEGKDVFKLKSPLSIKKPKNSPLYRDMLSYTIAASWAFSSVMLRDKRGMLLGANNGGICFWNPKMTGIELDEDNNGGLQRKNLNIAILGGSGSGKTVLTKKIVNFDIVTNDTVWVVDPKDEDYFGLSDMYDGKKFEFGLNDGKNKLNPFEIFGWKEFTEKERKHEIISHGEFLDGWLEILFEDKDFKNKIIRVVKKEYEDQEKNDDLKWLTFSDIEAKFLKEEDLKKYVDKFSVFTSKEHFLNGQSNIQSLYQEDFVVFQTSQIFNSTSESMKNASLVMLTQLIQAKAKMNKNTGKIFHAVIDEAHNFFNTDIGTLKISSLIREARGWNSGVLLISQNPQDFMGGTIMNNITTTFYGSLDTETTNQLSAALSISKDQEGLNPSEKRFILEARRGQFLVVVNSRRKETIQVVVSDTEFAAFDGTLEEKVKNELMEQEKFSLEQWDMVKEIRKMSNEDIIDELLTEYHESSLNDFNRNEMVEALLILRTKRLDEEFERNMIAFENSSLEEFKTIYLTEENEDIKKLMISIAEERFSPEEIDQIKNGKLPNMKDLFSEQELNKMKKIELIDLLKQSSYQETNLNKLKKQELIAILLE